MPRERLLEAVWCPAEFPESLESVETRHLANCFTEGNQMNITLDTNCIIALEENRPPDAVHLRCILQCATDHQLRLRVAAISASELQSDGGYSETFRDFEEKIARADLRDVEILLPPMIWDVTYWDHCIWGDEQCTKEAQRIHEILFPKFPFEYTDVDPMLRDGDRKWRNRAIDVLALWTHYHNGGGVFVTSDENFHRPRKKEALVELGAGEILRPSEAAARFVSG